jgi:hypothetical protein
MNSATRALAMKKADSIIHSRLGLAEKKARMERQEDLGQ